MDDKKIVKAYSLSPRTVELLKTLEAGMLINTSKFVDLAIMEKAEATLNQRYAEELSENE